MALSHHTASSTDSAEPTQHPISESDDDRYCRHCDAIGLAFDPVAEAARCRFCGRTV